MRKVLPLILAAVIGAGAVILWRKLPRVRLAVEDYIDSITGTEEDQSQEPE